MIVAPECEGGYTREQVEAIVADAGRTMDEFHKWMHGQTQMLCQGARYNHHSEQWEESCGGVEHGVVTYPWDLARFLDHKAPLD